MSSLNKFSRFVEVGLRLTGNWPGSPHKILFRLAWTVVMAAGQVLQYRYILMHFNLDELSNLVDSMSTALPYSVLFLKLIILWTHRRTLNDILMAIANDWTDASTVDHNMVVMIRKAVLSHRCSNLIFFVYTTAVILYSSTSVLLMSSTGDCKIQARELLIKMEIPFDSCKSPVYECVVFVQFLQLLAVGISTGISDALIVSLVLHLGGQIEIMHHALTEISVTKGEDSLSPEAIKSLIKRHYRIITLAGNVNKLFTHIALILMLSNTIIICCIGFLVIISLSTESFKIVLKMLFFYIAMTLEAFIFCFAGEYLSHKSKTIGDAAYQSLWYIFKPNDIRVMLLIMVRSQKQLTITAGQLMELSLESFSQMLKASASYVSVLHAMY